MNTTKLTSFPNELKETWNLFCEQWITATLLALIPAIPLIFIAPFLIEYSNNLQITATPEIKVSVTTITAMIALIVLIVFIQVTKAGLFILFSKGKGLTVKKAFKEGLQQFIPFIYTNILILLTVVALLIPAIALNIWYGNTIRNSLNMGLNGMIAIDLFVLIVLTILVLPSIFFAVSFTFAPVMVATKAVKGGIPSLKASYSLVRNKFFPILLRLIGWSIVYMMLARIASPLPIASWLVPFILTIIGAAFLVIIYKELK